MTKEKIIDLIYSAIDQVNAMLEDKDRLEKSPNTVILGDGGKMDSLAMINFIVGLEQEFQNEGAELMLADQMMNADDTGIFRTIDSLAAHIESVLG